MNTSNNAKDKFLHIVNTNTLETLPGLTHESGALIGFDDGTVSRVTPPCGPTYGGTLLDVHGSGFRRDVGGLGCKFMDNERGISYNAPIVVFKTATHIQCSTPDVGGAIEVQVEVTLNGVRYGIWHVMCATA